MFKYFYTSEKEITNFKKVSFEDMFYVVKDVNGNNYLICHGNKDGTVNFDDSCINVYTVQEAYDRTVKLGMIKKGEVLNICCCYGGAIKNDNKLINIVNTKKDVYTVSRQQMKNKMGRIVMYNKHSLLDKILANLFIMF